VSDTVLEFDGLWKKFRRGECYDSLRDLIPAVFKKTVTAKKREELIDSEFWALRDISFQLQRGEALGIIGPNGSGKSTTLKILSGILRPTRGTMMVKGRMSALIEVGAGFHQDLTGRENIYLNGTILGMKKADISKKLDEIIEFSGISDFIDTPVKRYSSGMYARLGFSIAAHVDPEVLLVDEVLSVGDMRFQEKCIKKMLSFKERGISIIFVSHNMEPVNLLCTRTVFLKKGELKMIGETRQVISEYINGTTDVAEVQNEKNVKNAIWGANLLDDRKQPCNIVAPQQSLVLEFKFLCEKALSECHFGFEVNRISDGLVICDYNMSFNYEGKEASGEMQGKIEFETNLLRGAYAIALSIYHYPSAKDIVYEKNIIYFSIEERLSYGGMAHLKPILQINRAEELTANFYVSTRGNEVKGQDAVAFIGQ
jgi:lipopolysaccharide transport system ATP-binding protein